MLWSSSISWNHWQEDINKCIIRRIVILVWRGSHAYFVYSQVYELKSTNRTGFLTTTTGQTTTTGPTTGPTTTAEPTTTAGHTTTGPRSVICKARSYDEKDKIIGMYTCISDYLDTLIISILLCNMLTILNELILQNIQTFL